MDKDTRQVGEGGLGEGWDIPAPDIRVPAAMTPDPIERFTGPMGSRLRNAIFELDTVFQATQSAMREPGNSPAMERVFDALQCLHVVCLHLVYVADALDKEPHAPSQSASAPRQGPRTGETDPKR